MNTDTSRYMIRWARISRSQKKNGQNEQISSIGYISELRPLILNPFEDSETSAHAPELIRSLLQWICGMPPGPVFIVASPKL